MCACARNAYSNLTCLTRHALSNATPFQAQIQTQTRHTNRWESRRAFSSEHHVSVVARTLLYRRDFKDLKFLAYVMKRGLQEHSSSDSLVLLHVKLLRFVFRNENQVGGLASLSLCVHLRAYAYVYFIHRCDLFCGLCNRPVCETHAHAYRYVRMCIRCVSTVFVAVMWSTLGTWTHTLHVVVYTHDYARVLPPELCLLVVKNAHDVCVFICT
jgi:hypothetical protein